jgi:hypothetical protein
MNYKKMQTSEAEVRVMFKTFCQEKDIEFEEYEFQEFLYHLDIDFRQWMLSNIELYFSENLVR